MKIYLESSGKSKQVSFSGKAISLLARLKINPVTVILVRNGQLISEEENLKNTDKVEILSVISGG